MRTDGKNFKSVAKEAKLRLKQGFWQNYRNNLQEELVRAKKEGMNESLVERYFAGKVTCTVKGGQDDEEFYEKVKALLLEEGEVSNAIGRLTDREYYDSLSYEEKQRYTLRFPNGISKRGSGFSGNTNSNSKTDSLKKNGKVAVAHLYSDGVCDTINRK